MENKSLTLLETKTGLATPYRGRDYEGIIRYEGKWHPTQPGPVDYQVKAHLKALVHGFSSKEHPDWHESRLEKLEEKEPGVWHYSILEPYLD